MDNFPILKRIFNSSLRISLLLVVIVWFVLTAILLNKYIVFASIKEVKKGGTFVEAIYEPISYLPYRGDPNKNFFYQTMLFPGCTGETSGNLCNITSDDDQTYTITINTGIIRSDDKAFSLEDIAFTYKNIVINNIWGQSYLDQYKDIIVSTGDTSISVKFPVKTSQNKTFFSLPILPKHIVEKLNIEQYVQQFSKNPIYVGCSTLTNSNDSNSLVIDLSHCSHSNINYYQIKSYSSYEKFLQENKGAGENTVSLYQGPDRLTGYNLLPIINNTYISLFFNTNSENLSPRIQRALGGLLYNNIISDHPENMIPYTGILAHHQSNGNNVDEFISSKNPKLKYDRQGLEQAGVKPLPETITISDSNIRQSYFFSKAENDIRTVSIISSNEIYSIKGKVDKSNTSLTIKSSSDRKKHTINLNVGTNKQIHEGVNTITIEGKEGGNNKKLLTIDLYYLGNNTSESINNKKLKIIYYNDRISNDILTTVEKTIKKLHIEKFFETERFDDISLFASAINAKEYDIVLTSLSMTSLIDIAAIITNEDTQKNPSSYQNLELAKLLEKYNREGSSAQKKEIIQTFSTDMPFVILGQTTTPYWIKDDLTLSFTGQILLKNLKNLILSQANIVSHMNIKGRKLLEKETFINFLRSESNTL